jgi:uncharacterized protein
VDWKIDLRSIKKRKVIEGIFESDCLEVSAGCMPFLEDIKVKIVVAKAKEGYAVGGYVRTAIEHPCTRCLTPVRVDINGVIEALYVEGKDDKEGEFQLENLRNVIYYTDPMIDLSERIIEAMVLEVPQQVLCKPDCKGLCPYCGVNLNEHPDHVCDKSPEFDVGNKFAALAQLKRKLEEG